MRRKLVFEGLHWSKKENVASKENKANKFKATSQVECFYTDLKEGSNLFKQTLRNTLEAKCYPPSSTYTQWGSSGTSRSAFYSSYTKA